MPSRPPRRIRLRRRYYRRRRSRCKFQLRLPLESTRAMPLLNSPTVKLQVVQQRGRAMIEIQENSTRAKVQVVRQWGRAMIEIQENSPRAKVQVVRQWGWAMIEILEGGLALRRWARHITIQVREELQLLQQWAQPTITTKEEGRWHQQLTSSRWQWGQVSGTILSTEKIPYPATMQMIMEAGISALTLTTPHPGILPRW